MFKYCHLLYMSLSIFTGKYGGKYYQFIDSHIKYTIQFPLEQALYSESKSESNNYYGPLNCHKCRLRTYRGVFMGYCHICSGSCKCSFENDEISICNMSKCIMNTYLENVDLQTIGVNEPEAFPFRTVPSLKVNYFDNLIEIDNSIATEAAEQFDNHCFIFDAVTNQTSYLHDYTNLAEQYIKSSYK